MVDVSFVIPAYNAEKYLQRCLESILIASQNFSCEIVVVNDGSTDGTKKICDQYEKKQKIRAIHKRNEGVSKARNIGIQSAKGRYIYCVDADDEVLPENMAVVLADIHTCEYDIIAADFLAVSESGQMLGRMGLPIRCGDTPAELAKHFIDYPIVGALERHPGYCGAKVFQYFIKKDLIVSDALQFPENIKYAEDMCFLFSVLVRAKTLFYYTEPIYKYYLIPGSVSHSYRIAFSQDMRAVKEYIESEATSWVDISKLAAAFCNMELQYFARHVPFRSYCRYCKDALNELRCYVLENRVDRREYANENIVLTAVRWRNIAVVYFYYRYSERVRRLLRRVWKWWERG